MSIDLLLVRADASPDMGTGHVMRCLALAQAWQDSGGRAAFAVAQATPAIRQRLASEVCDVFSVSGAPGSSDDVLQTIALARTQDAKWIAVDGYQFDAVYQRSLKAAGFNLIFLDDYGHAGEYSADIVLNQNVSADPALYVRRGGGSRLLLGPKYALLRREFGSWKEHKKDIAPKCGRLLVSMGGSDPENLSRRVIEALESASLGALEVNLVVGGSNPHLRELETLAANSSMDVHVHADVLRMAELMADSDMAISAAGSTCWELCLLGVPALLIDVADNQTRAAESLHARGCAIHVGDRSITSEKIAESVISLASSADTRRSLSANARQLVDGNGAARVVSALRSQQLVRIRQATREDAQLLWNWANDREVRAMSFSTEPIPWETHLGWLEQKLASKETALLIVEDEEGSAIGQVRFDVTGLGAELHISLAREKRGLGFAVPSVNAAVCELFARRNCEIVHAFVKPENVASAKVFEKAEFRRVENAIVRGHGALHYIRSRN